MIRIKGDRIGPDGETPVHEEVELWRRDPVECVKDLMQNPAFRNEMSYVAELAEEGGLRKIDEICTADWWHEVQVGPCHVLEPMFS
jgi:hypothetical protein